MTTIVDIRSTTHDPDPLYREEAAFVGRPVKIVVVTLRVENSPLGPMYYWIGAISEDELRQCGVVEAERQAISDMYSTIERVR